MGTAEVVSQAGQQVAAAAANRNGAGQPTVIDLIKRQEPAIRAALPSHLNSERFTRIAVTVIRTNPRLAECDPISLLGALMISAQLGLEPSGPLGHAYLVPYKREVQFQLGYKGIIELCRRSGQLSSIEAHEVCEADTFTFGYGLNDHLEHVPDLRGDRGRPYAYYAVAKFKDGGHAFVVLGRDDIEKHRRRSKSSDNGPWKTDYDAMARKTCIRALAPYLPLSPELERQLAADERVYRRVEPEMIADLPALPAGEGSGAEMGDGGLDADDGPPDPDYAPGEEPFDTEGAATR